MAVVDLTDQEFDGFVAGPGVVLVSFRRATCGPCLQFGPVFAAGSERHPEVAFGVVDIDVAVETATSFGIESVPRLIVWRDGVPLHSQAGVLVGRGIDELVEAVSQVDMDLARRQYDELAAADRGDQPEA